MASNSLRPRHPVFQIREHWLFQPASTRPLKLSETGKRQLRKHGHQFGTVCPIAGRRGSKNGLRAGQLLAM